MSETTITTTDADIAALVAEAEAATANDSEGFAGTDEPRVSIEVVAEVGIFAARKQDGAEQAAQEADLAWQQLADTLVEGKASGLSDNAVAKAMEEAAIKEGLFTIVYNGKGESKVVKPKQWKDKVVSSAQGVGNLRRVGVFLRLDGPMPTETVGDSTDVLDVTPRRVMTVIKQAGAASVVDNILANAASKAEAWTALVDASEAKKIDLDDEDEGDEPKASKVQTPASLLKAALGPITKAVGFPAEAWDSEAILAAESIIDSLGGRLADLVAAAKANLALNQDEDENAAA